MIDFERKWFFVSISTAYKTVSSLPLLFSIELDWSSSPLGCGLVFFAVFPTSLPVSDLISEVFVCGSLPVMGLVPSIRFLEKSKALSRLVSSVTSDLLKTWYQTRQTTRNTIRMTATRQPTTAAMMMDVWSGGGREGQLKSNAPGSSMCVCVHVHVSDENEWESEKVRERERERERPQATKINVHVVWTYVGRYY